MSIEKINQFYQLMHDTTQMIQGDLNLSYLEALIETAENILEGKIPSELEDSLSKEVSEQLKVAYTTDLVSTLTSAEKQKGFQLAILKGMQEDFVQPNHQMTPDTVGQFMFFFIQLFYPTQEAIHLTELGVGTGNLLSVILSNAEQQNQLMHAVGVEVDELLISLASISFAFQSKNVHLTHQDALTNLLLEPADVVVSDVPIGYYPEDETAKSFSASFSEGHSYAHYLLIEQSMRYMKDGGLGLFLIPSHLFEKEESVTLLRAIQEHGYIQAVVELPVEWFKEKETQKSLLVVQRKGESVYQAKEVLFAKAPDFKNKLATTNFLLEIKEWQASLS